MSMRTFDASSYATGRDEYGAPQEDQSESVSVIDRFSKFDGVFHSTRDLRVEGEVKGTIDCKGILHIAQGANVNAKIEAENISVAGDLDGDITCKGRLQILPSGRVRGKINTVTLVINEGAFYEGELEMVTAEKRLASGRAFRTRPSLPGGNGPVPIGTSAPESGRAAPEGTAAATQPAGNTFIRRFGGQETTWDDASPVVDGDDKASEPES